MCSGSNAVVTQVNMRNGSVADEYVLEDDFVHVSHNFGIHLWGDLLVVLGVSHMNMHIDPCQVSSRFAVCPSLS